MKSRRAGILIAIWAAVAFGGCASRPRQTPLPTTPVNEGAETMSAVRQQLQGRWTLLSLSVTTQDGRKGDIEASGILNSDAFGGLEIEYRMSEAGQQALAKLGISSPNPVVSTTGNVVINPQSKQITYAGEDFNKRALSGDRELAARRANPFALERIRYYDFGADGTLTLTTRYDDGKEAAVGRWKKGS